MWLSIDVYLCLQGFWWESLYGNRIIHCNNNHSNYLRMKYFQSKYRDMQRQTMLCGISFWIGSRKCTIIIHFIGGLGDFMLGFWTIQTIWKIFLLRTHSINDKLVDNFLDNLTILFIRYIYCHKCLNAAHCEFAFSIFWESMHAKIEPTFWIDSTISLNSIFNAGETILKMIGKVRKILTFA